MEPHHRVRPQGGHPAARSDWGPDGDRGGGRAICAGMASFLGEPATLVVDSTVDIRIVAGLSRAPGVSGAVLLEADRGEACAAWIDRYFAAHPDRPRHHALEDARALRLAYRATNEDGERPLNLSTL